MKIRETLLGLVVLGLVLGGVFWVRSRQDPGDAAPPGSAFPQPVAHAPADAAMPDVTIADRVVDFGDVRVTLSVMPRPLVALAKQRFRVRVESASVRTPADGPGAPLGLEGGRISFQMTMPMGDHRYALVPGKDGWQEAEVVLPMCQSGNRRWYATVEGTVAGRLRAAGFRLDLAPPGSAATP